MKNIGLILIAVISVFSETAIGQTNPKLRKQRFVTSTEKLQKAALIEKAAQGTAISHNPASFHRSDGPGNSTTAITFSDLGQSINPFTILGAGRNCVSVIPALNSVAFFRRGGDNDPGGITARPGNKVFYDLNTQGGAEGFWQISQGPIFNDDNYINEPNHTSQGGSSNFGARYPQGALFNPAGNTNLNNMVAMTISRVLDGSNDAWGGLGTGWKKLLASSTSVQELESSSDPLHFRTESMEVTANAVFTTEPIEDLSSGGVVFTDKIAIYKYEYNAASNSFAKTNIFIPFANEGGDYATSISNTAIAFGPDGNTGFLVVTAANNAFDSTATYIPYISKTTNGGTTWTDLEPIRINKKRSDGPSSDLDAFRNKMLSNLVYFDENGNLNEANYSDAAFHNLHYVDYLVNDIDLVVDNNNYAHLFASITVSGFGDTLNATFPGGITYYPGYGSWNVHMFFNNPQGTIKGELINQNMGLNGCWGDCAGSDNFTEANRPQAARSQDGSIISFAWYDTDTTSHPQLTADNNSNPDLWVQHLRVAGAGQFYYGPKTRNITKGSDMDGLAALGNVAPRLLNRQAGGYLLASTVSSFAEYDPVATTGVWPTQHLYVGNVVIPVAADSFPVQVTGNILNVLDNNLATISTSNLSSITSNSAVSGGNVSAIGTSAVTARGVCWSTTTLPSVSLSTKTINGSGLGSFTSNITGLQPGTTYYVRAYATNSSGTAYGNEVQFTTTSAASIPTVSTTTISGISQSSATGGGNVSSDGGASVTAKGVCWSTLPNPTILLPTKTSNGSGTGSFVSNLINLNPNTTYYVRAYATNSIGTAYGSQVSFTTSGPVQGISVTYEVDITNYLAGGATIGTNGIRIGGNFADQGATSGGSNMINWTPSDAASAMTDMGNNKWSITVTYPFSSVGNTQLYKFVNNDWGTNEGTDPSNTIATGGCGIDDGAGNINRTLAIPATNQTICFVWDACTSCSGSPQAPVVTTVSPATSITASSATVGGSATGTGISSRGVCYSTTPNPTLANLTVSSGTGSGSFSSNLTGLQASTLYYARAYATNSVGTAYGNQVQFSTLSSVSLATLSTTAASNIGQNTASSGGAITSDGGATITSRGVCWSTLPNPTVTLSTKTTDGSGTGTFTSSVTGLNPSTLYYIRAYATNSAGTAYGNQIQITTLASANLATLSTNAVANIAQNAANSGGSITSDGGAVITVRGICWSTLPNPTVSLSTKTTDGSGTGTFSSSMTGLNPSTTYYVRAYATNSVGTAYGNELSFTTLSASSIPTVNTSTVTNITQISANSGGTISSDGGSPVLTRGVCWSTSPNPLISLPTKTTDGTGTGTFASTLNGLSPGTVYYVKAYATNAIGTAYGAELTFTTVGSPNLAVITTNAISGITSFGALAGGQISTDGGTPVTNRGVCWSTSPGPTITLSTKTSDGQGTGSFVSNVSNLNPGTTYYLRAYATNSAGTSYGNERVFTTLSCDFLSEISGGGNTLTCLNPSAVLSVSGATSLLWSNGTSGPTITVNPVVTTSYYVVGSQNNGCTDTAFITVNVNKTAPPVPTVSLSGNPQFCPGQSALLSSSSTQNNQWFQNSNIITGATNQSFLATLGGNYFVRVTDPTNGCYSESDVSQILLLPGPVITQQPTSQIVAEGQATSFSIQLQDPAGASFQWQTNLGTGFQNLSDVLIYSGTSTPTLNLSSVNNLNNNQPFRCISTISACSDTSESAILFVTTTSAGKPTSESVVVAMPNPTSDKIRFEEQEEAGELLIQSILGINVFRQQLIPGESVHLGHLPASTYFFTLKTPKTVFTGKIILQH